MIEVNDLKYLEYTERSDGVSFSVGGVGIHGIYCADERERSVIADILCGAVVPACGSVKMGKDEAEASAFDSRIKLGTVLYGMSLYEDMTAYELLDFVGCSKRIDPDKRYRQIKEAMELTGVSAVSNKLIAKLSTAKRRRLLLAQALLGNPDTIIIEEPLKDLENTCAKDIVSIIRLLGKMKSVVLISCDDSSLLDLCEDIVGINECEVLFADKAEAIENRLDVTKSFIIELKGDISLAKSAVEAVDGVISVTISEGFGLVVECMSRVGVREGILAACENSGCSIRSVDISLNAVRSMVRDNSSDQAADMKGGE